jgi:hypothetical protein
MLKRSAALDFFHWRTQPGLHTLMPALPGAAIADTTFLADGWLGLVVTQPGDERQAWTLDPANHFTIDRLGSVAPTAPLAIRPDGHGVAFLQASSRPVASSRKALKGRRDEIVPRNQVLCAHGDQPNHRGGCRKWIMREVDNF